MTTGSLYVIFPSHKTEGPFFFQEAVTTEFILLTGGTLTNRDYTMKEQGKLVGMVVSD